MGSLYARESAFEEFHLESRRRVEDPLNLQLAIVCGALISHITLGLAFYEG